jgi:hypothetical protein
MWKALGKSVVGSIVMSESDLSRYSEIQNRIGLNPMESSLQYVLLGGLI